MNLFFKDLRAKAMVKPSLSHEHSYDFSLIQKRSEYESKPDSESESEPESESDSESVSDSELEEFRAQGDLNQSLNQY